jgi:type I restriction enzyme R subunit
MHALAKLGRFVDTSEPQQQRVERLVDCNAIGAQQRAIFHELRRAGNAARAGRGRHPSAHRRPAAGGGLGGRLASSCATPWGGPQKGQATSPSPSGPLTTGPPTTCCSSGSRPSRVVEAKRARDVAASHPPGASATAAGYTPRGTTRSPPGGPWGEYRIPFLFATNGRPFLRQLATKSGTGSSTRAAHQPLRPLSSAGTRPTGYRACCGRTSTRPTPPRPGAHGLPGAARLPARRHPRRRGEPRRGQARDACSPWPPAPARPARASVSATACSSPSASDASVPGRPHAARGADRQRLQVQARLENLQTFGDIFGIKELDDALPESDTKLHIATMQGMVKRILYSDEPRSPGRQLRLHRRRRVPPRLHSSTAS